MTPKEIIQALRDKNIFCQIEEDLLIAVRDKNVLKVPLNGKQFPMDPGVVTLITQFHDDPNNWPI